jgi:hypothetical protein
MFHASLLPSSTSQGVGVCTRSSAVQCSAEQSTDIYIQFNEKEEERRSNHMLQLSFSGYLIQNTLEDVTESEEVEGEMESERKVRKSRCSINELINE